MSQLAILITGHIEGTKGVAGWQKMKLKNCQNQKFKSRPERAVRWFSSTDRYEGNKRNHVVQK